MLTGGEARVYVDGVDNVGAVGTYAVACKITPTES